MPANEERSDAVKQAYKNKFGNRIITEDLELEFKKLQVENSNVLNIASKLSSGAINKHTPHGMKRTATGFTVDRVFDTPHNPFRTRMAIETPQNLVELYQRFRFYYQREPLVGTALELHTEFPLSSFQMTHEDPFLSQYFNEMAEDLNLFEFLLDMVLEYWCVGESVPYGILDDPKDPEKWIKFILLNPLNVDIAYAPITDGRSNKKFKLKIDQVTKDVVAKGPNDKVTGSLYARIPQDIIEACRGDGTIDLPDIQVSHFKRPGNYFKVRGESILYRIMHLLSYRDKLRDGLYSQIDRFATPREVWKVGTDNVPASGDELATLAGMIENSFMDPSQAIIWHHALQVDVIGGGEKLMPLRNELDGVEEEMLIGLYLNKGFLDSSYGAYANMSVALDVLISRYLTLRQRIERWMRDHVWAPICRIHNIYKPTPAELAHKIRIKNSNKRPWTPDICWDKQELRDNTQKVNLLLTLREKLGKPGFPKGEILRCLNYNPKTINKELQQEAKDEIINNKSQVDLNKGSGGGGGGGGGASGPMGDLGIDSSSLGGVGGGGLVSPGGAGQLKIDDMSKLPEFNGGGTSQSLTGGNPNIPAASQSIQNQNTPTNVGGPG